MRARRVVAVTVIVTNLILIGILWSSRRAGQDQASLDTFLTTTGVLAAGSLERSLPTLVFVADHDSLPIRRALELIGDAVEGRLVNVLLSGPSCPIHRLKRCPHR